MPHIVIRHKKRSQLFLLNNWHSRRLQCVWCNEIKLTFLLPEGVELKKAFHHWEVTELLIVNKKNSSFIKKLKAVRIWFTLTPNFHLISASRLLNFLSLNLLLLSLTAHIQIIPIFINLWVTMKRVRCSFIPENKTSKNDLITIFQSATLAAATARQQ